MAKVEEIIDMSLVDCQDSLNRVKDKIDFLSVVFAEPSKDHISRNVAGGMWTVLKDMKTEIERVVESLEGLSSKGISEPLEKSELTKSESDKDAYPIAKEVLKDKGLNPEILLGREGLSIDEYIIGLVIDSLKKLSLVKTTLNDEDLLKLEGYELDGIREAVDEIFNLLDASVGLHTATH